MSVYSKVPIRKPGRNAFNLSHSYKGSINIGELVPIARPIECVPGDTMITGNISKVELNPVITNFKGNLYFETWQFFVSNDMLYRSYDSGKFTEILASMKNPQQILPLPYASFTAAQNAYQRSYFNLLTGCPTGVSSSNLNIVSYPLRAPDLIVDEWFKDENLEPNSYNSSTYTLLHSLYHLNYKKDRYTSAFQSAQNGSPISLPLGNTAKLKYVGKEPLGSGTYSFDSPSFVINSTTDPTRSAFVIVGANAINQNNSVLQASSSTLSEVENTNERMKQYILKNYNVDLSTATAATINDLRLANKLQKWLERCQLCGTRTKEYLLANYGVTPNDETLQRPVLIGHTKVPVIVDEIVSNIKNTNASGQTFQNDQGSRGGLASARSAFKYGKWFCKEFGWIITLGALRPKSVYTGGIHKSLTKSSIIEYFNPIFEHLGQQAILNKELHVSGNASIDNAVFGYQDIYNEMRHMEDFISGDMLAAGFQSKNIWRNFASTPTLSRSFIEVKPTDYDYLFAVPSTTAPQAFFESANIIKAIRPISKRSIPSL